MTSIVGSRHSRSARRRCRRRLLDPPAATSSRSVAGRHLAGTTVARGETPCGAVSVGRRQMRRALMESSMSLDTCSDSKRVLAAQVKACVLQSTSPITGVSSTWMLRPPRLVRQQSMDISPHQPPLPRLAIPHPHATASRTGSPWARPGAVCCGWCVSYWERPRFHPLVVAVPPQASWCWGPVRSRTCGDGRAQPGLGSRGQAGMSSWLFAALVADCGHHQGCTRASGLTQYEYVVVISPDPCNALATRRFI
jgi:hypothetical protein